MHKKNNKKDIHDIHLKDQCGVYSLRSFVCVRWVLKIKEIEAVFVVHLSLKMVLIIISLRITSYFHLKVSWSAENIK